jgi:DNA-binding HxlR family transcriptional regulator
MMGSRDTEGHHRAEEMCPRYQRAVAILGKRWTTLIIRVLIPDARRFSAIKESVPGLSDRLLSERLKELESCGIVERLVFAETPVRIEYRLTHKGLELEAVVEAIQRWADCWDTDSGGRLVVEAQSVSYPP